jgi:UPF0716 protein FxsA
MARTRWYIALLLLIPLSDALLLVVLSQWIQWPVIVALVVLTGLVGMLLVRAEGRATLRSVQRKLATGDLPTNELMDGGMLIAAGAFLLTPGLVTDTLGFLLALPFTRYPIREALKRFVVKPYLDKKADGFVSGNVWVGGFPQGDDFEQGGAAGRSDFGDDGFGGGGVGSAGSDVNETGDGTGDRASRSGGSEDVYDVNYRVEEESN